MRDLCQPGFLPQPRLYEQIAEHTENIRPCIRVILKDMVGAFRGEHSDEPYWQLPRMGRACFRPVPQPEKGVVAVKGSLGQSPGSESWRQLSAKRWQALSDEGGGCMRVDLDEGLSFALPYLQHESGIEVLQVTAEGYSAFDDLLHEYQISRDVYEPLGVRVPSALALFRHRQPLPWTSDDEAVSHLLRKFRSQLPLTHQEAPIRVGSLPYRPPIELDSGLLFRYFKSAARLQDYYDMALAGSWEQLQTIIDALPGYPDRLISQLGATAGKLTQNGIVHG